MLRNRNPASAPNAATAISAAPENGAEAKNRGSISGSRLRHSTIVTATAATAAAA